MIPDEAVTAAAKVIYADDISNHAGDNAPQIIDACERVARKVLEAAAPHVLAPVLALADQWHAEGEADMAASKTMQDEHIAIVLLTDGATMVENARHIRNALGVAK